MTVNWKIYSPYLDIKQIISVLSYHNKSLPVKNKNQSSDQLQEVFSKSKANLDLLVDKLSYKKMTGSQFKVNIVLTNSGLYVKKGSMQGSAGSSIYFDAQMVPKNELLLFKSNVNLRDGEISRFLASFNNFGVKSFSSNSIKGKLSLQASLAGTLNSERDLILNSIAGNVKFDVKNGTLKDFEPIQKIGKIAFQNRDVSNITFSDLYSNATIKGDKINIKELKVTSNVLNFDVNGVYSLSNTGTNLAVKIPLRNPKDDYLDSNMMQREALRYKGIVINLSVVDGKDGETKIILGNRLKKESKEAAREEKKRRKK
jgi:hypothetical protein